MKILTTAQIREADNYTIKNEPIRSIDLMERASKACYQRIITHAEKNTRFFVFCGMGNNGGDGLAIARILSAKYKVEVFMVKHGTHFSDDCKINEQRLTKAKKVKIHTIAGTKDIAKVKALQEKSKEPLIFIDAIFGSGLSKPLSGIAVEVVDLINTSGNKVISVDIPSGLPGDGFPQEKKHVIKADATLTFQTPKLSFLLPENDLIVGTWEVLPIGLHQDFIKKVKSPYYLIEENDIRAIIRRRDKFSHKGDYGHALLVAGSYGKMGAAVLGTKACLRSGAGLLTTHIPKCGYEILQSSVPEAMAECSDQEKTIGGFINASKYSAVAVGPGIGTDEETANALKLLIQNYSSPIIFDADAINIFSENKTWLAFIPKNSIFTPHIKEFERLTGKATNSLERLEMQQAFSVKHHAYVILKGAHTIVSFPDGTCWFNSTGNPGMATAGSGDVLTGILLGLLAQGYTSVETAIAAVYLHGLSGDFAACDNGMNAMIAGDLISNLGKAFLKFE